MCILCRERLMMIRKPLTIVLVTLMSLIGLLPTVALAVEPESSAQVNRSVALYPEATGEGTFVTIEVQDGSDVNVRVVLGNAGNIEQTLRVYAIPADSGDHGGFVMKPYGTEPDVQTGWLVFPEQQFTFQPGEGTVLDVAVQVPKGTPAGEYVTSITAEQSEPFEIEGTEQVNQRVRWGLPVLIVVQGERNASFTVDDVSLEARGSRLVANVGITNTGNVTVRPVGEARLMDASGGIVGVSQIEMNSVYLGTDTHFIASWENVPPSDHYSMEIELTAEDGSVSVQRLFEDIVLDESSGEVSETPASAPVGIGGTLVPLTRDNPPTTLQFSGTIANNAEPIENARVSIVTYQDGVEVDRYPIMQAVTIQQGETPVEARYSLPGGFTDGTYTFEVTIELGDAGTQTVLVTQPIDFEVVVP